jgi:nucleoid DNA-binding protein
MRKAHRWGLAALVGTLGLVAAAAAQQAGQQPPQQRPADRRQQRQPTTFQGRMLAATKLPEKDLRTFLSALGPAISGSIASGQTVSIPGLGTFRVVNIPSHRDMAAGGRPIIVGARNYVEFLPAGNLVGAANSGSATPAVSVPQFEYIPLPDRVPGARVPGTRAPSTRQP